ncbi:MAG TPA: OmpA family protein [Planctomycetaceae bacterium]|nr:OmpA family protein [Planctomycetaceae bacterium]
MSVRFPKAHVGAAFALCSLLSACHCGPDRYLTQAQLRAQQMYHQNQQLASQRDGYGQTLGALSAEKQRLEQQAAALKANLDVANQRLGNLAAANEQLEQKYKNILTSSRDNPLSNDQIKRFEDLRKKYPEFEFDPETGVSKFSTDLLFASGSDQVTARSQQILNEFAAIMNNADAKHLKVLVVGHTDDKAISKQTTANKHPTNWHLSTNRADAVVLALRKAGINEGRMGAAGYSMNQPIAPNANDANRQKNRRVEIFVLAPDASIAGIDDATIQR